MKIMFGGADWSGRSTNATPLSLTHALALPMLGAD